MSTKKTEAGTVAKTVETTNGNNGLRAVSSLNPKGEASNFGRFEYTVFAELTPAQEGKILSEGILHIAQRAPASRVERILAGYNKREDMGPNWTRDQIAYSDATARRFETELANEFHKLTGIKVRVEAKEYVADTAHEPQYAEAKKTVREGMKRGANALAILAKNVGYTGKDLSVDNIDFLRAIDEARKDVLFRA